MKKCLRLLCLLTVLTLLPLSALGESVLAGVWNRAYDLLFATDNVTLSLNADFSWDGEWFKTLSGTHLQEGTSSRMEISLTSPRAGREDYTGGYTVTSVGGQVLSTETWNPHLYQESVGPQRFSVLTDTALRKSSQWLLSSLLSVTEGLLPPILVTDLEDGGSSLEITLQSGETPEVLNAALTLAAEVAVKKFLGVDFDLMTPEAEGEEIINAYVEFEDWYGSFETLWVQTFGEAVPEDLWDQLGVAEAVTERYQQICQGLDELVAQLESDWADACAQMENDCPDRYMLIRADNQVETFVAYGELLKAAGEALVYYEDISSTFLKWYNDRHPEAPLSWNDLLALNNTDNEELYWAYQNLLEDMDKEYQAQALLNQEGEGVLITRLGNLKTIPDGTGYQNVLDLMGWTGTTSEVILNSARKLEVDQANLKVEYDRNGKLTKVSGKVTLLVTDLGNWTHTLDITFTAAAGDYGTTQVEPLDISGMVGEAEYFSSEYYALDHPENGEELPETIVLDGVSYSTASTREGE